jgi:transglutaminase-like putative cysteine protease
VFNAQQAPRSLLVRLPGGEAGLRKTLRLMRLIVRYCKRDPLVRDLALRLVRPLPQRDYLAEVRALHAWVRDHIRYVKDVSDIETLHTVRRLLKQGQGDCDDKSVLLATLLESIGHKTRFAVIGLGSQFSHVLLETRVGASWLPLETTERVPMGWYPDHVRKRAVYYN